MVTKMATVPTPHRLWVAQRRTEAKGEERGDLAPDHDPEVGTASSAQARIFAGRRQLGCASPKASTSPAARRCTTSSISAMNLSIDEAQASVDQARSIWKRLPSSPSLVDAGSESSCEGQLPERSCARGRELRH